MGTQTKSLDYWLHPSSKEPQALGDLTADVYACPLSTEDSYGLLCYPDAMWKNIRSLARRQRVINLDPPSGFFSTHNARYWQTLWEPELNCAHEMRIGLAGDGGKWLCDPYAILGTKRHEGGDPCLIYSIGSNNEFSFEEHMHALFPHCEIHTLDHTVAAPSNPPFVNYHSWGLSNVDEGSVNYVGDRVVLNNGAIYSFPTVMKAMGHEKRTVHTLKIDIEGFETLAFNPYFSSDAQLPFDMILIEVHFFQWKPDVYKDLDKMMVNFMVKGYWISHKEMNIMGEGGCCVELVLVKMAPTFGK